MSARSLLAAITATLSLLVFLPILAAAGEPPNQNDPCSKAGRNTCGTGGVGRYADSKFGVRWFGDYRRAVAGVDGPTFCIDLRYWYPGAKYDYEKRGAAGLKNRNGDSVSAEKLQMMNVALVRYGNTNNKTRQAATMLFVHRLMGDARRGEIDPGRLGDGVRRAYAQIEAGAKRYAGPWKVTVTTDETLSAGAAAKATIKVASASGNGLRGVRLKLDGSGTKGLPGSATTGADGSVTVDYTPATPGTEVKVSASTDDVPAARPTLYVPTAGGEKGGAARSGQRLVSAATTTASAEVKAPVKAQPTVITEVSSQTSEPGKPITDLVKVSGLAGQKVTVEAALYGPYPARDAIDCKAEPVWKGSFVADGDGDYRTEPATPTVPGYYTYRERIADSPTVKGVETPCGEVAETTIVRAAPTVTTQVSAAETAPGAQINDNVVVSGLGALRATVNVSLYGPFNSRDEIRCDIPPIWTGSVTANGDGTYPTDKVTVPRAGYYTYRESLPEAPEHSGDEGVCGEASETTIAKAQPKVVTQVSDQVVMPGSKISDHLVVSGIGETPVKVEVELHGPFLSRAQISCSGKPHWSGTLDAPKDGEYDTEKVEVPSAGFYVYREKIAGSELVSPHETACAEEAETSLAMPLIQTGRTAPPVNAIARAATLRAASGPRPETDAREKSGAAPTSIRIAGLNISGPVDDVAISSDGEVNVPKNIRRAGWWRDGAAPGSDKGTTLIAGHIDSAKDGAGIFYRLQRARSGQRVTVATSDGKKRTYRITAVKRVAKTALPDWIFSRSGPRRLALVTCGGPFDAAKGHYRDNVVVTAVPI